MPSEGQSGAAAGFARCAFALMFLTGVIGLVAAFAVGLQMHADGGYWAIGIGTAAAIAFLAGQRLLKGSLPFFSGMSLATDALGAAFFLGIPGAIYAAGQDGLVYGLGIGAGLLLLQLIIAPRLAQSGAGSLSELLAARFPGRVVPMLAASIIVVATVALLAAGLTAAGLVGTRLLGGGFAIATLAAACAVLACFVLRGAGGAETATGFLYPVLLAALLVPLVVISAQWYGLPVPQLAYANSLWQLQGVEENLLEQDLADPAFMRPMLTAFLSLSPINFAGIVLAMATGIAALSCFNAASFNAASLAGASSRAARHSVLWGLVLVVLLLTLAPAAATYARQSIATLIAERTAIAELPAWVFVYGKLGLVHICGQAATDAAAVAQACASLPDASEALRLQDLVIAPDIVTLALPEMVGLSGAFMGIIAVATLAAAIVTAHAPLMAVACALGVDDGSAGLRRARLASYAIAAVMIAVSTAVALLRPASIVEMATWAVVVAAAGLFPAVVAALWWPKVNSWGTAAGMIAGCGLTLGYTLGRKFLPVPFYAATSALSGGGDPGLEYFEELKEAWLAAEPGAVQDAAWSALNAHALAVADWFGISGPAVILLALPAAFLVLVVVSLVTRAAPREETPRQASA